MDFLSWKNVNIFHNMTKVLNGDDVVNHCRFQQKSVCIQNNFTFKNSFYNSLKLDFDFNLLINLQGINNVCSSNVKDA